jgi:hypothetical protein
MLEYTRFVMMKVTGSIPLTQVEKRGGYRPTYHEADEEVAKMFGPSELDWYNRTCKARREGRIRVKYMTTDSGRNWIRAYECDEYGREISNLGGV